MVTQIYQIELYKAHLSDIEAQFFDLHLSVSNGFDSSKIYDKRDEFNLTVYFPFLDGDVPRAPSYGVYISQRIQFVTVSSQFAFSMFVTKP